MTYTVRHIGTVTVQAESEAALEAMLLSYWTPQSVGKVREAAKEATDDTGSACVLVSGFMGITCKTCGGDNYGGSFRCVTPGAPRPPREFVTDEVE